MRLLLVVVCLGLLAASECKPKNRRGEVRLRRCRNGDYCYPSRETLCELGKSLTGRLILPSDVDYRDVVLMFNRRITKYPGFVIQPQSTEDVQHALAFARKYNLEVSVKYDGFDQAGRSSNNGGMVIDMTAWKEESSSVATERSPEGEITLTSGYNWGEAYTLVDGITSLRADNTILRRLIVGSRYTEESVGGFLESGGVGPLSRQFGLAVDNLIEATMVTVKGKILRVSATGVYYWKEGEWHYYGKNTNIFYAIRGGGSGTFGVLTRVTFKLHFAPVSLNQFQFEHILHQSGQFVGRPTLRDQLIAASNLDQAFSMEVLASSGNTGLLNREGALDFTILQTADPDAISALTLAGTALMNDDTYGTLVAGSNTRTPRARYLDFATSLSPAEVANGYLVNTFIQPEVVQDAEKLDKLVDLLLSVTDIPTVDATSRCQATLLGGAIGDVPESSTPVNPLIRSALMMVSCYVSWPEDGDCDGEAFRDAADDFAEQMEEIGGGVYFRGASEDLMNWKTSIFGPNYGRLVDVKRMVDPDNFLYCRNCVGSDFRFDCFDQRRMEGMQLSTYLYYSSCGYMFGN